MSGGVERPRRLADTIVRSVESRGRAIERLPSLVKQLIGGETARDERACAVELLLCKSDLGRLLCDVGVRLIEALLRSQD